jgi:L-seryl-tRNA(Ser) seleniumtransferase
MRANPLYRALRADKLRLAALEATLEEYGRGQKVPAQQMMALTADEIGDRADLLIANVSRQISAEFTLERIQGESAVGGGSAPTSPLPTVLISLTSDKRTAKEIETALRRQDIPIVVRIVEDRVLIDLRTVALHEEAEVEKALLSL